MEEEFSDQPTEMPDFEQIAGIVRRRRWHFLVAFFCGWLLVWGISWFLPPVYRSGTLILVEQPAVPEKFVVSNIDLDIRQQLDSITQQILSRTRLLHIIDTLNLYAQDRAHKNPEEVVEKMRSDIDIELVRGDDRKLSSFNIYYSNRNPRTAQLTTAELANLFITENLEQRQERSENTTRFLEDQLDQARQKLAEQEARVREFKDKHVGELPSQTQSNLQILGGLQGQLQAEEDSLNRARQQNTYLESLLAQYRGLDRGTKSGDGGAVGLAAVDKELDRLKAQLTDLSSHYTDKHPDVRKTREQIARTEKMRERIVAGMNDTAGSSDTPTATSMDPKSAPILDLESQLKANRAEIANRQAAIKEQQSRIDQYQGRLNRAPVMEQQFTDITRDYEQSKANYDSLLAKKNQSEMATDLEKTQQGEHFRMLDPPNLPVKPFKPNRLLLCGVGLVVGLIFGAASAVGSEMIGGKIYTEREIKKLVRCEIIAEIPTLATMGEQALARRNNLLASVAALVIVLCILAGSAITYLRG
jgi:polysaccharide chain length determinant protein (PEP-CTERM system associated)